VSETRDKLEAKISQVASQLASWRSLQEHPQWKPFLEMLEQQKAMRLNMLIQPLANMAALLPQEFMKGEAAGLHLAQQTPELQVSALENERKRLEFQLAQIGERNANSRTGSGTDERSGSRVDDERFSSD
jgi:hypothetical protein